MGYPIIIVIGSKSCEQVPKVEVHINGVSKELEINLALTEITDYLKHKTSLALL